MAASPPPKKVQVPSPLPSRRGATHVPPQLRENVTSALLGTKTAIPAIQSALSAALDADGWTQRVREYLLEVMRQPGMEQVPDAEVLAGVVAAVMAGTGGNGRVEDDDKAVPAAEGQERLKVPGSALDAAVKTLRKELDGVCVVVDDVDWEGLG